MIILQQTSMTVLGRLEDLTLQLGLKNKIIFESNFRNALTAAATKRPGRTVMVISAVFQGSEENPHDRFMTPEGVAHAIKTLDPEIWCFILSSFPPKVRPPRINGIDGIINKPFGRQMYDHILEFLALDFDEIESLEALRAQLPWLK